MSVPAGLTELDEKIMTLAARHPVRPGEMCNLIRDLGLGEISYYRRLNELLDTEAALAAYPTTVKRLRRLRHIRYRNRAPGWRT